ncbi:Short-chain dehydrogenase/reductase tropE [Lasiodiplodia theobromae]|uniref:Short-chain dehydrogenase/reductase tropE n=1 Tax=Lasiodiplodia theobromae TaxID=45133 RepID=A0A5N5CUJ8_9PEZI|nr:Short-chain dehydrogenase/reductase tropE [Lasiodiplodia theobromae]
MAAPAKRIVLITGATSGIGLELAAQLLARTHPTTYHVLLGARNPTKGATVLSTIQSRIPPDAPGGGTAEVLHLDVTSDTTITAAAAHVRRAHGRLDILVNNAGTAAIDGHDDTSTPAGLRAQLRESFDVNATGPAVVTAAFADLLLSPQQESDSSPPPPRRIVNISSGAGSITRRLDPSSPIYALQATQYRASKAALNMVTACQHVEFGAGAKGVKVHAYDPGFTVSNLGPPNRAENSGARPAAESVAPLVELLEGSRDGGEEGLFLHNTGAYPW